MLIDLLGPSHSDRSTQYSGDGWGFAILSFDRYRAGVRGLRVRPDRFDPAEF
ncbi:MAG: hypothetical protein JGK01_08280 [Microcoleus sp. PH2017_03_ELD_O_A]|nr:hypothetical protein [Microcoleus sp. PH2017_03_ELD_O_A]